jgi:uncharacterized protein YyaL (SSP411 family)
MRKTFRVVLVVGGLALTIASAQANYKAKAIEATDYLQRAMYDEKEGLYRGSSPVDPKGLYYDVMWGNGVQFSVLAGAVRYQPERYKPILYNFTQGLNKYWDKDALIPGFDAYFSSPDGDDKYYDDNAWLVLGFTEAYGRTRDKKFLDWARRTQDFVLSGWDDKLGGGIYWYQNKKESKNTCINAPAAVGALALYEIERKPTDLEWAKKLTAWTTQHLQDKDGLFWDNIALSGKIEKTKWTYNSALMIRANLGLWRVSKDKKYLEQARRIADAALAAWVEPQTGAFKDSARFNHLLAESLIVAYEATKDIKYLNAVRRNADFGYRYVRDVGSGGYWNQWSAGDRKDGEAKTLIESASATRVLWLLAPYSDIEELKARGDKAARSGDNKTALICYQQAIVSTAGTAPLSPVLPKPAS